MKALLFFDLSGSSDDFHGQVAEFHGARCRLEEHEMSSRGWTDSHSNRLSDRRNKLELCVDKVYSAGDSVLYRVPVDGAHVSAICKLTNALIEVSSLLLVA